MASPALAGRAIQDRLGWLLSPLAWPYAWVAARRRRAQARSAVRVDRPVISVGNLTCGGTGKTPTVEMIVRDLELRGRRPAILSRGYKAFASPGSADASAHNDEFLVLAENLPGVPHIEGADRVASARRAIASGADVLVLDDGFQHVRLARDLDLVLVDALDPFGGGRVLPAGRLRESPAAIRDADLIAITRTDLVRAAELEAIESRLVAIGAGAPVIWFAAQPTAWVRIGALDRTTAARPVDEGAKGTRVAAFSAIGNSDAFRRQLELLGVEIVAWRPFIDHHVYSMSELRAIARAAGTSGAERVVTTQKDAVKLGPEAREIFAERPLDYLRIEQRIARGADVYGAAIDRLIAAAE